MRSKVFQIIYYKGGEWHHWARKRFTFMAACEACEALQVEKPELCWKPHYYLASLPDGGATNP